jgi:hypothetical protein
MPESPRTHFKQAHATPMGAQLGQPSYNGPVQRTKKRARKIAANRHKLRTYKTAVTGFVNARCVGCKWHRDRVREGKAINDHALHVARAATRLRGGPRRNPYTQAL